MNGWLAFMYIDLCDLNSPAPTHGIAARHLEKLSGVGLYGLAFRAAQARRRGDSQAVLDVARELKSAGSSSQRRALSPTS